MHLPTSEAHTLKHTVQYPSPFRYGDGQLAAAPRRAITDTVDRRRRRRAYFLHSTALDKSHGKVAQRFVPLVALALFLFSFTDTTSFELYLPA